MFGGNVKSIYIILTLVFQGYIFLFSATISSFAKKSINRGSRPPT